LAIPVNGQKFFEKDLIDKAIDGVLSNDNDNDNDNDLTEQDLNRVTVAAQVQFGIDTFRAQAAGMSMDELKGEKHSSARLGRLLELTGQGRPARCHAHAIISGNPHHAAVLRALMARLSIRIDDPDNGCWLPENTAATPHPAFPRAIPHSRIHRYNYYFWLRFRLGSIRQTAIFRKDLQLISKHLQQHTCPEYVMLTKGDGLPNRGRV